MQKLLSIGLLVIFTFAAGGRFVAIEIAICKNRALVKSSIAEGHLQRQRKIILTESQAEQLIDGDEISYQSKRYDIVSTAVQGDKLVVFAINDKAEENLITIMQGGNGEYWSNTAIHGNAAGLPDNFFKEYRSCKPIFAGINDAGSMQHLANVYRRQAILKGFSKRISHPPKPDMV